MRKSLTKDWCGNGHVVDNNGHINHRAEKKEKLTEIDGHQGEEEFRKQGWKTQTAAVVSYSALGLDMLSNTPGTKPSGISNKKGSGKMRMQRSPGNESGEGGNEKWRGRCANGTENWVLRWGTLRTGCYEEHHMACAVCLCAYEICAENQISSSPFSCVAVILGRTPENASNTDMSKWWRKSSLTYNQHITPSSALTNSPTPVTGYVVGCASVCTYWFRSTWIWYNFLPPETLVATVKWKWAMGLGLKPGTGQSVGHVAVPRSDGIGRGPRLAAALFGHNSPEGHQEV